MGRFKIGDYVKYAIVDEKPDGDGKVFCRGKGVIIDVGSNDCYTISDCECFAKENELEMSAPGIKDFVKSGSMVEFDFFMDGNLYYIVEDQNIGTKYRFFVPIEDTGHSTFKATDKAIHFMRWIRKAIESGTFQKISE